MKKNFLLLFALICLSIANAQTKTDSIYITPDIPATFVGGDSARIAFIKTNLITDKLNIDNNLTQIYVQFVVEKSGEISNAVILKSINKQTDDEVLRMVKIMPKWTPSQHINVIVRSQVIMPIKLKNIIVETVIDTTYFNKDWKKTSSENADYYRIRKKNGTIYNINYYFKSGGIVDQGEYSSLSPEIKHGHFVVFYDNGIKKSEYNCVNDTIQGESFDYYPSGKLKSKINYLNNNKNGVSFEYLDNDSLLRKKVYKDGVFISFEGVEDSIDVYSVVEILPDFPGGDNARLEFLSNNIKYPQEALENEIQGTVYTQFVVERDGSITNIKVLKGIGGGCDEECVRIVKLMPKWNPGMLRGKYVRTEFILPILFKLS
ncbi:MAG: TonB family protein [Bacteroidota bacterium]